MDILAKRLLLVFMSMVLMGITFEAVRRRKLLERYSVFWMACGAGGMVCAIFPSIPDFIARKLGLTFIEAASYIFSFFLVMVIFHISIAISKARANQEASARKIALLQAEVEKLKSDAERARPNNNQPL